MNSFRGKIFPPTRLGYYVFTLLAMAGFAMFLVVLIRTL